MRVPTIVIHRSVVGIPYSSGNHKKNNPQPVSFVGSDKLTKQAIRIDNPPSLTASNKVGTNNWALHVPGPFYI